MAVECAVALAADIPELQFGLAPQAEIAAPYEGVAQLDAQSGRTPGNVVVCEIGARIGSRMRDDDACLSAARTDHRFVFELGILQFARFEGSGCQRYVDLVGRREQSVEVGIDTQPLGAYGRRPVILEHHGTAGARSPRLENQHASIGFTFEIGPAHPHA